jgi:hypothetical protein
MHRGNNILVKAYIGRIKGILISLSHIYIERVTRGLTYCVTEWCM